MATRRRSSNKTITGTVSDLQRRVRYLQANTPPSRLANQVVARANVRPRAIDSDQIALQAITNDQVSADAIAQANMQNNSVGEEQIIDGSVTNSKVADDAIATGNLQNSAVTTDKLNNSSVTTNKVNNLAITTGKLANAAVNESKLGTSAVTEEKIRNGAVARSKIQDRAVGVDQIADSAVTTGKIGNGQVTNAKIGGIISGGKIGSGFNGANINNSSISNGKLSGGTRASAGLGLRKSGDTLSVNFSSVANSSHTHRYTYFRREADGSFLTGQVTTNTGPPTGSQTPSSKKYKTSISDHEIENPKNLLNLKLKRYKYIRSKSNYHRLKNSEWAYGYIAEEVGELGFPEVISYDKKGNPDALDYGLFSIILLEIAKAQQEEIDYLKKKIEEK